MSGSTDRRDDGWVGRVLVLAVGFGLAAGLGELALLGIKRFAQHRILHVSRDVIWMAPLTDIGFGLLAALILVLAARRSRRLRSLHWAVTFTVFPALLTLLLHYRPLHIAAKILLAAGLAYQSGYLLSRRPRILSRLARWASLSFARRTPGGATGAPSAEEGFDPDRRRFLLAAGTTMAGLVLGTRGWLRFAEGRALGALPDAAAGSPDVLLIVLDTVRAESLSLYGYARSTTPGLERWAARGVVFDHAFATAPWTLPTHASMFTGRWHHELSTDWDVPLDDAAPTIAEAVSRSGYATAGIVANPAYTTWEFGLERGFAHWEDYRTTPGQIFGSSALGSAIGCGNMNEIGCRLRGPLHWYELLGRKPADVVRRQFGAWLDRVEPGRPFFTFLNFFDAHTPYLPPAPYATRFGPPAKRGNPMHRDYDGWEWTADQVAAEQTAYDSSIAFMDAQVSGLLDDLEARGVLDHTIVIITADHGEEFKEHGVMTHGNSLYSPSLHVPLLIFGPGIPAGRRIGSAVSVRDIAATIDDLTATHAGFPGASLARYWNGSDEADPGPMYAQVDGRTFRPADYPVSRGDMHSVLDGRYHYIRRGDGEVEMYDVREDPWEHTDLSGTEPARVDTLARLVDTIRGIRR
jgi:arylsulfatase A-like enzyme